MITAAEFKAVLGRLGLAGKEAEIHSSFKSFGGFEGGPVALAEALTASLRSVLVPTFTYCTAVPPPGPKPERNGTDPEFFEWLEKHAEGTAFSLDPTLISEDMGVLNRVIAGLPGARRGLHPSTSWAALGEGAAELVGHQDKDRPMLPVERLEARGGFVLMLGTSLTTCTALHLAEHRAGRRFFYRWSKGMNGETVTLRVSGCSDGFEKLRPRLQSLLREEMLGTCRITVAPLKEFLEAAAALIRAEPEITVCEKRCARCRDAVLGGPELS